MLKAVEKKRAYEGIVEQIRKLIEEGRLKRGDQLPTERELGETLKVSRATVREAIRTLESMKLVQSRQGNGTYVLASSEEALVQPLASALFHEKDDILDILFIRKIIEPYVAMLAAENTTMEEINEMEVVLKQQADQIADGNITMADTDFHALLARMAKNRVLARLLLALFDLLEQTREQYLQNEERAKKSLKGHEAVFAAIKKGDCAAARRAMLRHLEQIEEIIAGKKRRRGRECR